MQVEIFWGYNGFHAAGRAKLFRIQHNICPKEAKPQWFFLDATSNLQREGWNKLPRYCIELFHWRDLCIFCGALWDVRHASEHNLIWDFSTIDERREFPFDDFFLPLWPVTSVLYRGKLACSVHRPLLVESCWWSPSFQGIIINGTNWLDTLG